MTTRLILVCHAPTAATRVAGFAQNEEPVEDRDRVEAAAAAGALRRIDRALRGPERRCADTAAALGLDAAVDPALADLDVGRWRGRGLAELDQADPAALAAWLTDPDVTPHGGEPLRRLLDRVGSWLDMLCGTGERVVAITHPAVVRAAALHVLRAPATAFWRIDAGPLTQTRLSASGDRWTLNETGHPLSGIRRTPGAPRSDRPGPAPRR